MGPCPNAEDILINITAPKGLGDSILLRAVVLHLLDRGEELTVFTRWRDLFADLPVSVLPLSKRNEQSDLRAVTYSNRAELPAGKTGFEARCTIAGITEPVELQLRWKVRSPSLLDRIKLEAAGRPIFIYQPLKRAENEQQKALRPLREGYHSYLSSRDDCFRIKLGHPPSVEDDMDMPCELDLYGKAFIFDTFDICTIGDEFFGEPCFIIHAAEALDRKVTCMFSRRALASHSWVRLINPQRVFHKMHLATAIGDDLQPL